MNRKTKILTVAALYGVMTAVLYVKNIVLAAEPVSLKDILVEEQIDDQNARATLRAFYTAPPVIPHEIVAKNAAECLDCHRDVTRLEDGRVAMATPHPQFSNCMQCHVPGQAQTFDEEQSDWQGLEEPERGDRWFALSPPTVPHRLKLRENCLSCHGPQNPDMTMRTTHPQRTNCLQCHVPNVLAEF
ncbi:MAG: nitrate reductase cytochrome c-type subunit [Candidatus Omnitrophica bacterium]|nr:nitrate reductase cytochrome c-type subunit [Candidatus Omnitrophota bacterium]